VYRVVHGQPTPLRELAPALPDNVLDAVDRALQKDPAARPQDIGAFILELTGRPLHSFHTGQPRNVDSAAGLEPTHTPRPTGPTTSWPKTHASSREPVRSGAVTVPPPTPGTAPRLLWPFLAVVALVGVALGGAGVFWASRRNASPPPVQTASMDTLEPLKRIEPPPPPPPPAPRVLAAEPAPPKGPAVPAAPAAEENPYDPVREKPSGPSRRHRARPETPAKGPEPHATVAAAEPAKAVAPEPPAAPAIQADGIKPEARKLLDQAEDALSKGKPLDAARLVDQSFYIQKTPLGYAIQARAACQRHDIGGARAAFRNVTEPQLKQLVLRVCVRQGVWLF